MYYSAHKQLGKCSPHSVLSCFQLVGRQCYRFYTQLQGWISSCCNHALLHARMCPNGRAFGPHSTKELWGGLCSCEVSNVLLCTCNHSVHTHIRICTSIHGLIDHIILYSLSSLSVKVTPIVIMWSFAHHKRYYPHTCSISFAHCVAEYMALKSPCSDTIRVFTYVRR